MKKDKREIMTGDGAFKYFVYYPDRKEDNLPLLIFLHGIGERGNNLEDIERFSLPNYMSFLDIPFVVIAPQCHKDNFWNYHLRDVERVIEREEINYHYDTNNIFVLGSSMGAYGAWNYLMERPNLFRGIVLASGGISFPVKENLELIKDKPILIYHGDNDDVVDVESSIKAYEMLKDVGASNTELKIIPGGDHYVCSHTYEDKYVYDWIKKNITKEKRKDSKKEEKVDLLALMNASANFDVSLVQVIVDLLCRVEKEDYVPFIYQKESNIEKSYVGITKCKNIPMFSESEDIRELFNQKMGYDMVNLGINLTENNRQAKKKYVRLYDINRDYKKKAFTFEFILNMFGEVGVYYPSEVCKSNFNELGYVQDFIKYLFNLQFVKDGKKLNYEEMKKALEDYLKLEKGKVRSKSLL